MSFTCASAQDALVDFLEGCLDPVRAEGVVLHLCGCTCCARDYFDLKLHWDGCVAPDAGDAAWLLSIERRLPQLRQSAQPRPKAAWTLAGGVAAAVALSVALLLFGGNRGRNAATQRELSAETASESGGQESERVDTVRTDPLSTTLF